MTISDDGYPARIKPVTRFTEIEDGEFKYETTKYILFENHDSLQKLLCYGISVAVVFIVQLITIGIYGLFLMFTFPLTLFWLACGCFFYQSKLISMKMIWNMWFGTWTNSDRYNISEQVDSSIMNEALLVEFLFLSVPQIVLQSFNNFTVKNQWNVYSIAAYALSCTSFINGISRYGYFIFVKHLDVAEVPLEVNICNKKHRLPPGISQYERKKMLKFGEDETTAQTRSRNKRLKKIYEDHQGKISVQMKRKISEVCTNPLFSYAPCRAGAHLVGSGI